MNEKLEALLKSIHEHRAPTDKSVELLREMEKAALADVVGTLHVSNTMYDFASMFSRDEFNRRLVVRSVVTLNSRRVDVATLIKYSELEAIQSAVDRNLFVARRVHADVAKAIADKCQAEVLELMLAQMSRNSMRW